MTDETAALVMSLAESIVEADPDVRWQVVARLADVPGQESELLLIRLLADPDYRVREKAVAVLSGRFNSQVARACVEAMADDENAGRRAAGLSLLTKGGLLGMEALVEALTHTSADVRLAAAMALPSEGAGPNTVSALEKALVNEVDANVRAGILLALGRTRRREAIRPLLLTLEQGGTWQQIHALEALAEIGDPDVAPRLLPFVDIPALRRATLRTLSRLESLAPAEDLAFRAARGETDTELLSALRHCLTHASRPLSEKVREIWFSAGAILHERLLDESLSLEARSDAAHLIARLNLPGAASEIVRAGRTADGFAALGALPVEVQNDLMTSVLQEEDPDAAFVVIDSIRRQGELANLAPLLVHPSPQVQATVLSLLPPGHAQLEEVIEIMAEEDPETVLPAALFLAQGGPGVSQEALKKQWQALLNRAHGMDGPGREAALIALGSIPGEEVDDVLRQGLASENTGIRRACAVAVAGRSGWKIHEVFRALDDPDATVRAALLRALARWAERGEQVADADWRDVLIYLADEPTVSAAAGEAIIALAGGERSTLAEEMLAQGDPIRRSAIEEVSRVKDSAAANAVAIAVTHEDIETVRGVLRALVHGSPQVAEQTAMRALTDERPEVRTAAAEMVVSRGEIPAPESRLPDALAKALASERDEKAVAALIDAVAVAGRESALDPLTLILARERVDARALAAAQQLATRHEREVRRRWASSPPRAERRWAAALAAAARTRAAQAKGTT